MKYPASRETVASRLDHIELLLAMYPSEDELMIEEETKTLLSDARCWCEDETAPWPRLPTAISLCLSLDVSAESKPEARRLLIHIDLPLAPREPVDAHVSFEGSLRVSADWLTRAQAARLQSGTPADDILASIEHVRDQACVYLATLQQSAAVSKGGVVEPEVRSWFYFPSISTREKRDDLVNHAPSYQLSGFLLAGKPGVLCLEGVAQNIDDFMKFIKTESWGNIPSGHKKVSEVLREICTERSFTGMEEITDQIEKHGARANRSDMKALERWLGEKGLGETFAKVLM